MEPRKTSASRQARRSTAILHTGFDASPNSLESLLVARGYHLLAGYAREAGIAVERVGAVLVAWDDDELATLPALAEKAEANGYQDTKLLTADEVYALVPSLGAGARGGLPLRTRRSLTLGLPPWPSPTMRWLAELSCG